MKKLVLNGGIGIVGSVSAFTLQNYNEMMAAAAATATTIYMAFKAAREALKWQRDRGNRVKIKLEKI